MAVHYTIEKQQQTLNKKDQKLNFVCSTPTTNTWVLENCCPGRRMSWSNLTTNGSMSLSEVEIFKSWKISADVIFSCNSFAKTDDTSKTNEKIIFDILTKKTKFVFVLQNHWQKEAWFVCQLFVQVQQKEIHLPQTRFDTHKNTRITNTYTLSHTPTPTHTHTNPHKTHTFFHPSKHTKHPHTHNTHTHTHNTHSHTKSYKVWPA